MSRRTDRSDRQDAEQGLSRNLNPAWAGDHADLGPGNYGDGEQSGTQGVGKEGAQGYGQYPEDSHGIYDIGSKADERLRQDAIKALSTNPDIDKTKIEVQVFDRVITLMGSAPDRSIKRMAEDAVAGIPGVLDVMNQISVERGPSH